ncbi:COP9 signalosome complex subunit 8-like [Macrobrachium rosenbergii]|uniref:COP9 signalosome complex subunit 8-like n=1 Tax=Macrobrachium rosenbergii TaxID=79674 RepID=UPI0034D3B171
MPPATSAEDMRVNINWGAVMRTWSRSGNREYKCIQYNKYCIEYCLLHLKSRKKLYNVRQRAIDLVARAYTSISADDFAQLFGANVEEAVLAAKGFGWGYDEPTHMILPSPRVPPPHTPTPSEEQLRRLADYVSFLEN